MADFSNQFEKMSGGSFKGKDFETAVAKITGGLNELTLMNTP